MYNVLEMKSIAKVLDNRTFTDYYYRLMLIAKSVFKWENLPNGISEKWIEKYLFTEGKCMFFKSDTLGFMVAKCTEEGLNEYDEPINLRPVSTGYIDSKVYKNNHESILIKNNDCEIPTKPTIELFAYRLSNISRTADINIHAQKTPLLIVCSEKQRLTMKNVFAQYSGNEPVIYGDKSLNFDNISVLKTDAPIVFDKLQIQKHEIWNEAMTFLGVNNANQDKKERLVDDEVQANNEQIIMSAQSMLKAREEACEQINKLFKLNIKVSLRIDSERVSEVIEDEVTNVSKQAQNEPVGA